MSLDLNSRIAVSNSGFLIIGTCDQVGHTINEMCVLRFARDRALFMPLVPIPSSSGKFLTILER